MGGEFYRSQPQISSRLDHDGHRPHIAFMPFYEYQATSEPGCDHCLAGFECLQKMSAAALTRCPECGGSVRRRISAPNISRSDSTLSKGNLEDKGFTQYKRVSKGQYEKTAGRGPDTISDD